MGIHDEDVQRVRDGADLVALISEHLALKRVGRNWVGLCPFHAEKTPSFSVSQERGRYHCFGCGVGGDAISFVREIEHLDFVGAVEKLAARQGVKLRFTDEREGRGRARRTELIEVVARAVDFYHQRLLSGEDAGAARSYLRARGVDGEVVRQFKLGWAPDSWDAFVEAAGAEAKDLVDAGLAMVNRRNRLNDFFRARIMFPIFDPQGDPIGFGGRVLPGSSDPRKYLNSAQNKIYDKSKVLYGLHWAKADAVNAGELLVCEGYTDVIGFARVGLPRAVATCGTALTEDHIRLMKRFAPRIVLAFDADSAGQAAAERVYQWEQSHEVEVAVADLPAGADPGDLASEDPDRLRDAVARARPFLRFRVDRVLGAADLRTAESRARTAEAALAVVAEHPSNLVRDQYLMDIAEQCRIDVEQLRSRLSTNRPLVVSEPARRPLERDTPELEALRLAIHRPEDVAPYLDEALFESDLHAAALTALAPGGSLHDIIDHAAPPVAELLSRLAVEETDAQPLDVVTRLVHEAGRRTVDRLRREGSDAALRDVIELGPLVDRTRDPSSPDLIALEQLVAFIAKPGQGSS